jgi:hypothetical protein
MDLLAKRQGSLSAEFFLLSPLLPSSFPTCILL